MSVVEYLRTQPSDNLAEAVNDVLNWQQSGVLKQDGAFVAMATESGFNDDFRTFEAQLLAFVSAQWAESVSKSDEGDSFQERVHSWVIACFGEETAYNKQERNHRFLEESLELVQSLGCTEAEAQLLVDYVFNRPPGDPPQEVGGVMVTLASLCQASDLAMMENGDAELKRNWTLLPKIREKHANKPRNSPLPQ